MTNTETTAKTPVHTRVHLKTGGVLTGKSYPFTDYELAEIKDSIGSLISHSGTWQINVELSGGRWVCVPGENVAYVELVTEGVGYGDR